MSHPRRMEGPLGAKELWNEVLQALKGRISARAFETWFSETRGLSLADGRIIVEVPNEFYIDWLEQHYSGLVREALEGSGYRSLKVVYKPGPKLERLGPASRFAPGRNPETQLQSRYTFENFVVGKCN